MIGGPGFSQFVASFSRFSRSNSSFARLAASALISSTLRYIDSLRALASSFLRFNSSLASCSSWSRSRSTLSSSNSRFIRAFIYSSIQFFLAYSIWLFSFSNRIFSSSSLSSSSRLFYSSCILPLSYSTFSYHLSLPKSLNKSKHLLPFFSFFRSLKWPEQKYPSGNRIQPLPVSLSTKRPSNLRPSGKKYSARPVSLPLSNSPLTFFVEVLSYDKGSENKSLLKLLNLVYILSSASFSVKSIPVKVSKGLETAQVTVFPCTFGCLVIVQWFVASASTKGNAESIDFSS